MEFSSLDNSELHEALNYSLIIMIQRDREDKTGDEDD